MATEMQLFRGTAGQFASLNPVLEDGELGVELDTGLIVIGDGVTPRDSMVPPFVSPDLLLTPGDLVVASADGVPSRLLKGAVNQRLTVNADGTLGWVDMPNIADMVYSEDAFATYATKLDADIAHASFETSAHASATYKLASEATSEHANFLRQSDFYNTYVTKYAEDVLKEPKWMYAYKAASTTRASTVTYTPDPELLVPVVQYGVYIFEAVLFVSGFAVSDFALTCSAALCSSWHMGVQGLATAIATGQDTGQAITRLIGNGTNESAVVGLGASDALPNFITARGSFTVSTAGNWSLNWAQGASSTSATTLMAGSHMKVRQVA